MRISWFSFCLYIDCIVCIFGYGVGVLLVESFYDCICVGGVYVVMVGLLYRLFVVILFFLIFYFVVVVFCEGIL